MLKSEFQSVAVALRRVRWVIETPPNVLGVIDDHWFQYVTDFSRVGPDKGKGGKLLLLPTRIHR
jgi:hypothetical protein